MVLDGTERELIEACQRGDQEALQPSTQGDFSTTLTLDDGENLIKLTAILPSGESTTLQRTVTYSTEDF